MASVRVTGINALCGTGWQVKRMSWKWKTFFQWAGHDTDQSQDGNGDQQHHEKFEDIHCSCNGNVKEERRKWSSWVVSPASNSICSIDVSIEKERRIWRLKGLLLGHCRWSSCCPGWLRVLSWCLSMVTQMVLTTRKTGCLGCLKCDELAGYCESVVVDVSNHVSKETKGWWTSTSGLWTCKEPWQ